MTDNTNIIKEALERLIASAKLLQVNCELCCQDHHEIDFRAQGLPGWLVDTQKDIDAGRAALALIEKGEVMWSGTSEEGVTSYYPQDFAAEYIERTTGVKMTKVLVIPLEQEQSE